MANLDYLPGFKPVRIVALHLRAWCWSLCLAALSVAAAGLFLLGRDLFNHPPRSLADFLGLVLGLLVTAAMAFAPAALGWRCRHARRCLLGNDLTAAEWAASTFAALFSFSLGAGVIAALLLVPLASEFVEAGNWGKVWATCAVEGAMVSLVILAGWTSVRLEQAERALTGRCRTS